VAADFPQPRAVRQLAELVPGTLIGGYRIEGQAGAGGMAVVFRAREESLGRPVALKVLSPGMSSDAEFRERFVRESRAASAVDHPSIIPVHAAGEDRGVLYLAMRYVAGGDLHSLVEREGPLPPERAIALLAPVASALDAAHAAGIVHRDVKPANVLIDSSPGRADHPYLSDFGLAKRPALPGMTNAGEFVGTAGFASPEQLAGHPVSRQTDQYGLACVAYLILTASMPFHSGDPQVTLWAQMSKSPPRVTDRRPDLPPEVDRVIARALARDPAERFASCGEFTGALRQALAATTPPPPPAVTPARPRKAPIVIGAVALAVVGAAAAALVLLPGGHAQTAASPRRAAHPPAPAPRTRPPVTLPAAAGWWKMDEGSGNVAHDSAGSHPATGTGTGWCGTKNCMTFNGTSSALVTGGPVVNTAPGHSFTVSAWVAMGAAVPGGLITAVSQDGAANSGFYLEYSGADQCWAFARVSTDVKSQPAAPYRALGCTGSYTDWTYLTGVFDATGNQERIYVNGKLEGTAKDPAPFAANGPLVIGRGQGSGGGINWWPDAIGNVEAFNTALTSAQVRLLYSRRS